MKHIRLNLRPTQDGPSSVVVVADDGTEVDITDVVSDAGVERYADGACAATITLPWATGEFLATSVHVPRDTHTALVALGWTPPQSSPPGVAPSGNK